VGVAAAGVRAQPAAPRLDARPGRARPSARSARPAWASPSTTSAAATS